MSFYQKFLRSFFSFFDMDWDTISKDPKKSIRPIAEIMVAVLFAIAIRTFIFQPFKIPSESMVPTMVIGDYLVTSTGAYGYSKHSFPFSLPLISDRIFYTQPDRGDVVVFRCPLEEKKDEYWIKRLVGIPGDKIQLKSGILYINGNPCPQERIDNFKEVKASGRIREIPQYLETMPNGLRHKILRESAEGNGWRDNTDEVTVPADHFFMMGDNRNHSNDTRADLGFVHRDYLIGQAKYIIMSFKEGILDLYKFWDWPMIVRLNRFFTKII